MTKGTIEKIASRLGFEYPTHMRKSAAEELGKTKDPEAVFHLIGAFFDPDLAVETAAVEALIHIGPQIIEPYLKLMEGEEWITKGRGRFPIAQAARWRVQSVMTGIGSPAVDPLIRTLRETNSDEVQKNVADALGRIRPPAVEVLVDLLRTSEGEVRAAAARALGSTHDKRAIAPLLGVLKDSNTNVRRQAAEGLALLSGDHKPSEAVKQLLEALGDQDEHVREKVISALKYIKDPQAVEPILSALVDSADCVREEAAWSLSYFQDERALKPLAHAIKDPVEAVQKAAAYSLKKIKGED